MNIDVVISQQDIEYFILILVRIDYIQAVKYIIDPGILIKTSQSHVATFPLIAPVIMMEDVYNLYETSTYGNDVMFDHVGHGTHIAGTIAEGTPDNIKIIPSVR